MNWALFWIAAREWAEISGVVTPLWRTHGGRRQLLCYAVVVGFILSVAFGATAILAFGDRIPKEYLTIGTILVGCYLCYESIRHTFFAKEVSPVGLATTGAFSVIREVLEMIFMIGLGSAGQIDWIAFALGSIVGIAGPIWFLHSFKRLTTFALPIVGVYLILHGLQIL